MQQVSDLHLGHTMCGSMIDIQSTAAEIRRGKKEEENKSQGKNIVACRIP